MSSFGSGLGTLIGSSLAAGDLSAGQNSVNSNTTGVMQQTQPFVNFGQSFMPTASAVGNEVASNAGNVQSYDQFASGYTNTPAAQYQLGQANAVQNSSAAANGQLLSGANERALGTIDNGIVAQNENQAYTNYLAGNNQQFSQLTSALGSLLGGVGVGTTATGQDVSAVSSQNSATSSLAQAEAKNDQSKGSGIGSIFGGLGSAATNLATSF